MTFDKLADRCLLFVEERKQMIVELLKEAELELTRKCNMYEDTRDYTCDGALLDGVPTGYFIRNNGFHLNYKSSSGTLRLSYYGTVDGAQDPGTDPSPVIPDMYHRDLCNYAIAISAAINSPGLHDKHWVMWQQSLEEIINQDADRELVHTIKREV